MVPQRRGGGGLEDTLHTGGAQDTTRQAESLSGSVMPSRVRGVAHDNCSASVGAFWPAAQDVAGHIPRSSSASGLHSPGSELVVGPASDLLQPRRQSSDGTSSSHHQLRHGFSVPLWNWKYQGQHPAAPCPPSLAAHPFSHFIFQRKWLQQIAHAPPKGHPQGSSNVHTQQRPQAHPQGHAPRQANPLPQEHAQQRPEPETQTHPHGQFPPAGDPTAPPSGHCSLGDDHAVQPQPPGINIPGSSKPEGTAAKAAACPQKLPAKEHAPPTRHLNQGENLQNAGPQQQQLFAVGPAAKLKKQPQDLQAHNEPPAAHAAQNLTEVSERAPQAAGNAVHSQYVQLQEAQQLRQGGLLRLAAAARAARLNRNRTAQHTTPQPQQAGNDVAPPHGRHAHTMNSHHQNVANIYSAAVQLGCNAQEDVKGESHELAKPEHWIYDMMPWNRCPFGEMQRQYPGSKGHKKIVADFKAYCRVRCFALSPDGRCFAAQTVFGSIGVWDAAWFSYLKQLDTVQKELTFLTWSADSTILAAGTGFGDSRQNMWFWKVANGEFVKFFSFGLSSAVCWSPDMRFMCSIIPAGFGAEVIDVTAERDWKQRCCIKGKRIESAAWSPDGSVLAVSHNGKVSMYRNDTLEETLCEKFFAPHGDDGDRPLSHVSWSPDSKHICCWRQDLVVWKWRCQRRWIVHSSETSGKVLSAAWSPDSTLIATGSESGYLRVWHTKAMRTAKKKIVLKIKCNDISGMGVSHVAWSPCGKRLFAVVDNRVTAYSVADLNTQVTK